MDNVEIYGNSIRGIQLVGLSDNDVSITNSVIHSHNVSGDGAAISMANHNTVTIAKSVIRDNVTTGQGGAIYVNGSDSSLTITNSFITGNQGSNGGTIRTNSGPTVNILNSTFANNQGSYGGVFYICATGSTTIKNSIFWGNTSGDGKGANIYKVCGSGNIGTISYSDISTDSPADIYNASFTDGGGNIDQDPLFVGGGDYHISNATSPVIDAATETGAPADDIDGDLRPQGAGYDMGADEYVSP